MSFSAGDRVHVLDNKTYGGKTIAAGTCGIVTSYSSLTDSCTVEFDGDPFARVVRAADLAIGCGHD